MCELYSAHINISISNYFDDFLRRKNYVKVRSLPLTFLLLLTVAPIASAPTHVATIVRTALHFGATLVIGPVRRVGGSPSQGVAVRSLCGVLLRLLRPNNAAAIIREQRSKPRLTVSQRQQAAPEASC